MPVSTFFIMLPAINPARSKEFIIISLLGVLSGALTAYITGFYLWAGSDGEMSGVAKIITDRMPALSYEQIAFISKEYSRWGFLVLVAGAYTFMPYGLFAIFSGITGMNVFIFIFATITGHGIKFLVLSYGTVRLRKPALKLYAFVKTGLRNTA